MKKRVIAMFLAALLGLSVTACATQEEIKEAHRVSVSGILPETGNVVVTTTYIGTVEPKESVEVYPMVDGTITQMSAVLGKEVRKSDVLFTLDNTEANAAIAEAQEEYDVLKKAADQAKADAEKAEKEAEAAKKDAATTNLELIKTNITSVITEFDDSKEELDEVEFDLEDELDEYIEGNRFDVSAASSRLAKSERSINVAETAVKNIKTELAKIELTEVNSRFMETNLTNAEDMLTKTKDYLKGATVCLNEMTYYREESKIEDEIVDFLYNVDKAKEKIESAKDSMNKIKNNLPVTANLKVTTGTTTSGSSTTGTTTSNGSTGSTTNNTTSNTNLTTTVTTAYDQQLLLAEKKLNEAKAKLALYQVLSPIDGTVEAVYIGQNEKAFMAEPCLVVSNKSNMEVTFQVPETVALALNVGDRVKVEKNGGMHDASITEVGLMADVQTKLFTIKASLGAVQGFSTGTDVKVYAETQKAEQVMKIPYDSLYFQGGDAYVYCVVDDEAVRRPVQVGLMNDESAQILEGLAETDIVISTWSSQLKDGAAVDLLFVIGNGNTVDIPQDEEDEEMLEITDDSDPIDMEDMEEEEGWELPDWE